MALPLDTLEYAKRLREAGFTMQQAEGQAHALAAAMTGALATKQDLRELELHLDERFARIDARFAGTDARFAQIDARFAQVDACFDHTERHLDTRLAELSARFHGELADLARRVTLRLGGMIVAGIGVLSALETLF